MLKLVKNLIRLFLFIIISASLLMVYARYIEPNILTTKEVNITSSYVHGTGEDIKIAVFADTHFSEFYTLKDFTRVQKALQKASPDLVVFAGDLIDNFLTYDGDISEISRALSEIEAPLGKFAIFGNHDYGGGAERHYQGIMEEGGFTVLKNESFSFEDLGLSIIGIDDVLIGYGDLKTISLARPENYNIVLSHVPDVVDDLLDYPMDLMISAHTHGRQVNLKFFDDIILPPYGKKYIKGLFQFENQRNTNLYVNPGVGTTQLPYRFLSPPEVSFITIKSNSDSAPAD